MNEVEDVSNFLGDVAQYRNLVRSNPVPVLLIRVEIWCGNSNANYFGMIPEYTNENESACYSIHSLVAGITIDFDNN
jgi:hypothetical protein